MVMSILRFDRGIVRCTPTMLVEAFSTPVTITASTTDTVQMTLGGIGGDRLSGQVHAVISRAEYDEQWQLVASAILYTMNNGSGFSTLLDVSGGLSQVSNARLSLDLDGHAHVIFTQSQNDMGFNPKLYYTHNRSGAFIRPCVGQQYSS